MRMCKKWMALGLAAMMALSLTACKGSGSQGSKASDESAAAKAEGGEMAAAGGTDKSEKLVIYTNSGSNGRDAWLKDYAKQAGYNVEVVQIQGGDLASRIISEKKQSSGRSRIWLKRNGV